jgi:hypothetical protein
MRVKYDIKFLVKERMFTLQSISFFMKNRIRNAKIHEQYEPFKILKNYLTKITQIIKDLHKSDETVVSEIELYLYGLLFLEKEVRPITLENTLEERSETIIVIKSFYIAIINTMRVLLTLLETCTSTLLYLIKINIIEALNLIDVDISYSICTSDMEDMMMQARRICGDIDIIDIIYNQNRLSDSFHIASISLIEIINSFPNIKNDSHTMKLMRFLVIYKIIISESVSVIESELILNYFIPQLDENSILIRTTYEEIYKLLAELSLNGDEQIQHFLAVTDIISEFSLEAIENYKNDNHGQFSVEILLNHFVVSSKCSWDAIESYFEQSFTKNDLLADNAEYINSMYEWKGGTNIYRNYLASVVLARVIKRAEIREFSEPYKIISRCKNCILLIRGVNYFLLDEIKLYSILTEKGYKVTVKRWVIPLLVILVSIAFISLVGGLKPNGFMRIDGVDPSSLTSLIIVIDGLILAAFTAIFHEEWSWYDMLRCRLYIQNYADLPKKSSNAIDAYKLINHVICNYNDYCEIVSSADCCYIQPKCKGRIKLPSTNEIKDIRKLGLHILRTSAGLTVVDYYERIGDKGIVGSCEEKYSSPCHIGGISGKPAKIYYVDPKSYIIGNVSQSNI